VKALIACGASGGHIFPAIALGSSLKNRSSGIGVLFVGSRRYLDMKIFRRERVDFRSLSSNKLPYKPSFALAGFFLRLFFDVLKSAAIVLSFSPDVVVGFGGYVSFPVLCVSRLFGIPLVIHEQNVTPGRANAVLFRFADKIALSFGETLELLPRRARDKALVTGNPIRKEMLKDDRSLAAALFGLEPDVFTILVIGGSQGAHRLNRVFAEAVIGMEDEDKKALQVIHIAGEKDREWISAAYDNFNIKSRVFSFLDKIDGAYSLADLVFTRSGSAVLFELAFYAKPMVLVPYPYALNHQKANADIFVKRGAAICKEEKDSNPREFKSLITDLMSDADRLKAMSFSSRSLARPQAADELADTVIGMCSQRRGRR
jgi:UDP-N-acetylglucosamine--N-acetylmuramyl-(pentapeptide) pyrophosphoryl-undecaprenol N-acetylglucosamine transferase